MEQSSLKQVAQLNDASVALFTEFAERKRFRRNVNLKRLRRELSQKFGDINSQQLLETFKQMQNLGLGSIIYGRGGKSTQFLWNFDLKDVAKAAKGEIKAADLVPLRPLIQKRRKYQNRAPKSTQVVPTTNFEVLLVPIGSNEIKRFIIPSEHQKMFVTFLSSLSGVA